MMGVARESTEESDPELESMNGEDGEREVNDDDDNDDNEDDESSSLEGAPAITPAAAVDITPSLSRLGLCHGFSYRVFVHGGNGGRVR